MAFVPVEDRLQLRVEHGESFRTRSWGSVKPATSDAALREFAVALGGLTKETVDTYLRVKIGVLAEE